MSISACNEVTYMHKMFISKVEPSSKQNVRAINHGQSVYSVISVPWEQNINARTNFLIYDSVTVTVILLMFTITHTFDECR